MKHTQEIVTSTPTKGIKQITLLSLPTEVYDENGCKMFCYSQKQEFYKVATKAILSETFKSYLEACNYLTAQKAKNQHNKYVAKVKHINPDIEVLGFYKNATTKILHRCKIDNYMWEAEPSHIINGHGCPQCGGVAHKTHTQYVYEVQQINNNIKVIGTYVDARTKILHQCKKDGYEWYATPNRILSGTGCPVCGGRCKHPDVKKAFYSYYNAFTHIEVANLSKIFNISERTAYLWIKEGKILGIIK